MKKITTKSKKSQKVFKSKLDFFPSLFDFVVQNSSFSLPLCVRHFVKFMTLPIEDNTVGEGQERGERKPVFGCAKGQFIMSDDFDAPLDDFKEYM